MFRTEVFVGLAGHYDKRKGVLEESQDTESRIEILNIPEDSLIVSLDNNFCNSGLFSGARGECKRGDYIIISEAAKIAVFIEMKKTGAKEKDIVNQLKGSLCAFKYLQVIAKHFYDEDDFLANYTKSFVSFKHTAIAKRKTKIDRPANKPHNRPENMLRVSWAKTIQFKSIV